MYKTKYLGKFIGISEEDNLRFKLCVYYHAQTELFDRTLTNLRSPYDPTEAYTQGRERSLSYANARQVRQFINNAAISFGIQSIDLNTNKYRYSAQGWIDEYNRLVENGEMYSVEELRIDYEKVV